MQSWIVLHSEAFRVFWDTLSVWLELKKNGSANLLLHVLLIFVMFDLFMSL